MNDRIGLQFNIDESILYQVATDSLGESDAASGLVRFYGQWELLGRGSANSGLLVFKGENRHRMTAITPFDSGFEAGSILPTGTFFSEFDFGVTNLYWKQYFFDRQLAVAVGRIDVTDFVDVYAMMNPLTHFLNLAFSTNPTIAVPNQGLGAAAGAMLTEHLYVQGGFGDANGQPTLVGFDTFFDDSEYFSYAEVGATTSQDRIYLDNVHVTLWNTDARRAAGTPRGHGVAFTAQKFVDDKWLPFFRFGYADGDAALMQTTFSTGLGCQRKKSRRRRHRLQLGEAGDRLVGNSVHQRGFLPHSADAVSGRDAGRSTDRGSRPQPERRRTRLLRHTTPSGILTGIEFDTSCSQLGTPTSSRCHPSTERLRSPLALRSVASCARLHHPARLQASANSQRCLLAEGRVGMWRGGLGGACLLPTLSVAGASVAPPCSVSTSRSSNRTCGSPASGFRTRAHAFAHGKLRLIRGSRTSPSSKVRYSAENRDIPTPLTLCFLHNQ